MNVQFSLPLTSDRYMKLLREMWIFQESNTAPGVCQHAPAGAHLMSGAALLLLLSNLFTPTERGRR